MKKNILIIGNTNLYGGVGHIIEEYCNKLYGEDFHFDFLYYEQYTEEEIVFFRSINASFYTVPRYSRTPLKFIKFMRRFCAEKYYDIIHCHASTAMLVMYALPFYLWDKTLILYHSHLSSNNISFLHCMMRFLVCKISTKYIAVSKMAGIYMYGKKGINSNRFCLLKNGICYENYLFSKSSRDFIRNKLGISEDEFVIGNIGRFEKQKNHKYIIDVFKKFYETNRNAKLILIGDGSLKKQIQQKTIEFDISDAVLFLPNTKEVCKYYSAMDVFLFPSKYEGLGIVAVEAQISGLPVIASTKVPIEADISPLFHALSLDEKKEAWVDQIYSVMRNRRESLPRDLFEASGYSIDKSIQQLKDIYVNRY